MYYAFGRIFQLLVDIEPVILETGGLDTDDPDDQIVFNNGSANTTGVWSRPENYRNPLVRQEEEEQEEEEPKYNLYTNQTYDLDTDIRNFNLADFDWTFGLLDNVPGFKYLLELAGPFQFGTGFLNGTQITKSNDTFICEDLIKVDLIMNAEQMVNVTGIII